MELMRNRVYNLFGTFYSLNEQGFMFVYLPLSEQWLCIGVESENTFVVTAGVLIGLNWSSK